MLLRFVGLVVKKEGGLILGLNRSEIMNQFQPNRTRVETKSAGSLVVFLSQQQPKKDRFS